MQTLTGQWTKLYTHKFRIQANEFTVDFVNRQTLEFLTLARTVEIVKVKIWLREKFVAPSLTECSMYLLNENNLALGGESDKSPIVVDCLETASDYSGEISFKQIAINDQLAPTKQYLRLVTNNIFGGAAFTAGEFDIWVTTSKMP